MYIDLSVSVFIAMFIGNYRCFKGKNTLNECRGDWNYTRNEWELQKYTRLECNIFEKMSDSIKSAVVSELETAKVLDSLEVASKLKLNHTDVVGETTLETSGKDLKLHSKGVEKMFIGAIKSLHAAGQVVGEQYTVEQWALTEEGEEVQIHTRNE